MAETTFHVNALDGLKLAGSVWEARRSKRMLVWIHGFAEHRKRYAHFAAWLNEHNISVAAIDLRGHGDSQGKRGHVHDFSEYYHDCSALLHFVKQNFRKTPVSLGSHSHGGLVAARYLQATKPPVEIHCAVFSAPFLGLPPGFPLWKKRIGEAITGILPKMSVPTGIDPQLLSHDDRICRIYASDPLIFSSATARWFTEATLAQARAVSRAPMIRLPVLVMQGTGDRIVSQEASRRFYEDIGSERKVWIPYQGMYHEILNETDRLRVYEDVRRFVKKFGS